LSGDSLRYKFRRKQHLVSSEKSLEWLMRASSDSFPVCSRRGSNLVKDNVVTAFGHLVARTAVGAEDRQNSWIAKGIDRLREGSAMSRHNNQRRLTAISVLTNEQIEFNLIMRIVPLYLPDIPRESNSTPQHVQECIVPCSARRYISDFRRFDHSRFGCPRRCPRSRRLCQRTE
jgi:hypothetical protein